MPLRSERLFLSDENATIALAEQLAPHVKTGARIYLRGDLGAGKTTFVRALLRTLGVSGRIKSPSFSLVEPYKVFNLYCYHFDFYRFSDPREWLDAGFRDVFNEEALILIEWPELANDLLPQPDLMLDFVYRNEGRELTINVHSEKGLSWLNVLLPR